MNILEFFLPIVVGQSHCIVSLEETLYFLETKHMEKMRKLRENEAFLKYPLVYIPFGLRLNQSGAVSGIKLSINTY